jgi:hypothetical protein
MAYASPFLHYFLSSLLNLPSLIMARPAINQVLTATPIDTAAVLYHPICLTVSIIPCQIHGQRLPLGAAIVCTAYHERKSLPIIVTPEALVTKGMPQPPAIHENLLR